MYSSLVGTIIFSLVKYYKNSNIIYILKRVSYISKKIFDIYVYSKLSFVIGIFANKFKSVGNHSVIIRYFKKEVSSLSSNNSVALRLTYRLFNFPSKLTNLFYSKFQSFVDSSIIFNAFKLIVYRLDILLAISFMILFFIPDPKWHNIYFSIMIFSLSILFIKKCILQRKLKFDIAAIDPIFLIFMLVITTSFVFSLFPLLSLRFFIFYITCFMGVLLMVSILNTKKSLSLFIEIVLMGTTFSGIYGLYQHFTGSIPFDPSLTDVALNQSMPGRIYSTMGNPNNYAEVLILTLPFFISVILNSKDFTKKLLFGILGLIPFIVLFLTGSRSGWICFGITIFLFIFFKNKRVIPLFLLLGIIMIPFLPDYIVKRFMTVFNPNDSSLSFRGLIFETYWPVLKNFWFSGLGLGTDVFMSIVGNKTENPLGLGTFFIATNKTPVHTHNLFTEIWIETGILGILFFVWSMLRIIKSSILNIIKKIDPILVNLLIASSCSLIGVLIMGMGEYIWYYTRVMAIFWMDIGILLVGNKLYKLNFR